MWRLAKEGAVSKVPARYTHGDTATHQEIVETGEGLMSGSHYPTKFNYWGMFGGYPL